MSTVLRRWLPVMMAVAGLSVLAAMAAGSGMTWGDAPPRRVLDNEREVVPATPSPTASPTPAPEPPAPPSAAPTYERLIEALVWVYLVAVALLLLGIAGYLVYHALRRLFVEWPRFAAVRDRAASQPDDDDQWHEQVREAVRASLADIDAGGDARRAVIACWLRLERLARSAGTAREAADTPRDLVARLLARHRVSDQALADLADAYRSARYAPAAVDDSLVRTAQDCLRTIDRQLASRGVLR